MSLHQSTLIGGAFALAAAMCNGTVGILSRSAFSEGLGHADVAFWRSIGAFALLTAVVTVRRGGVRRIVALAKQAWKIALCALLGIFTLYHFETEAFTLAPIPLVAVLVYAGGFGAILLDIFILKEAVTPRKLLAIVLVFGGGYVLIDRDGMELGSALGVALALLAGFGYASFIFAWKLLRLPAGLESLWWFFLFGTLFLAVPFTMQGPTLPSAAALPTLAALAALPSFCGFYFTTLALRHLEAYKTQVIEGSEPIFSAAFAALLFAEFLTLSGTISAAAVIAGAVLTALPERQHASA